MHRISETIICLLFLSCLLLSAPAAGEAPLLMQQPTLSDTHIVFVFAGDLRSSRSSSTHGWWNGHRSQLSSMES
jgi:hypothetical protein